MFTRPSYFGPPRPHQAACHGAGVRSENGDGSTWTNDPRSFREQASRVRDVLDQVHHRDGIQFPVRKALAREVADGDVDAELVDAVLRRPIVEIDATRFP